MLDLLLNLAVIGLMVGSLYALIAAGFALIYNMTGIFHLAHGGVFTVGAYLLYVFFVRLQLPLFAALGLTCLLTALVGAGIEAWIYRPLRRTRASELILFLSSVGVLIVVEGVVGLLFGTEVLTLDPLPSLPLRLGSLTVSTVHLAMLGSWLPIAAAIAWLLCSRQGRFLRAIGDAPQVAVLLGLPQDRLFTLAFALGSALVAPAALLYVWHRGLTPYMGLHALLIAAAAVLIGGRHGLLPGAITAAALGLLQSVVAAFVPTGWEEGVAFLVLLLALLVRPQGIFGYALRW